ncbi:MAG: hypothetical protein K2X57_27635 [Xanthobacteraceae bacterium]|nr:hypothetical protein [Xanthobacteraceae bacterium]
MLEIVGSAPELAGCRCDAFICDGFVYKGELISNASVAHLCFGGEWRRLIIDYGVIIWRRSDGLPSLDPGFDDFEYPQFDVGVIAGIIGHRLESYSMEADTIRGGVEFLFDNGSRIAIVNENDRSTFEIVSA